MHSTKTSQVRRLTNCAAMVPLSLVLLGAVSGRAQIDNFNNGNDTNWTHLDLTGVLGPDVASYTFPSDGNGGKAYQISVVATPPPYVGVVGPARSLSYRADVTYTGRFTMGVDVLGWNNNIDEAFGPFWYAQNLGLGTVTGYTLTYDPYVREILISSITFEQRGIPPLAKLTEVNLVPGNRYRFVVSSHDGSTYLAQAFSTADLANPLWSTIAQDSTYSTGYGALLTFDGSDNADKGAEVTYDNYAASVPAANSLGPIVAQLIPQPGGHAGTLFPTITVKILNRDTTVNTNSILLWIDGLPVTGVDIAPDVVISGNPATFGGATVTYPVSTALSGEQHTTRVAFANNTGTWQTNTWTWDYPFLNAANSLPLSTAGTRGFNVRLLRADAATPLPNSIETAESMLATPPGIPAVFSTNYIGASLNYAKNAATDTSPYFTFASDFPGIDPANCVNVGMQATAWLALPAGITEFGVYSDDGFELTAGANFTDPNAVLLGYRSGGTYDGTFQIKAEAEGLYPVRFVFNQGGGGAYVQLYTKNVTTGERFLVNSDTAGAIKAYATFTALESSSNLSNFTIDSSAVIDTNNKTITVAKSGSQRYYRILTVGPAPRITGIQASGSNVILQYQ